MGTHKKTADARSQLRERIIAIATELFTTKGIRPVKMDDIANHLSISKRTLYEIFKDKEELLLETVKRQQLKHHADMTSVSEHSNNIMEVILHFYLKSIEDLRRTNYRFFEDIKKYPNVMKQMENERDNRQKDTVQFFQKGIEQGLFKENLDMRIVIQLMNSLSSQIISEELIRFYPLDEIFRTFVFVFVRGIATKKGEEIFDQTLNEHENKTIQNLK